MLLRTETVTCVENKCGGQLGLGLGEVGKEVEAGQGQVLDACLSNSAPTVGVPQAKGLTLHFLRTRGGLPPPWLLIGPVWVGPKASGKPVRHRGETRGLLPRPLPSPSEPVTRLLPVRRWFGGLGKVGRMTDVTPSTELASLPRSLGLAADVEISKR